MNKDTHVYCTSCKHGDKLIEQIINDEPFKEPKNCIGCDSCNPEDSMSFEVRPNYIEKESDGALIVVNAQKIFNTFFMLNKEVKNGRDKCMRLDKEEISLICEGLSKIEGVSAIIGEESYNEYLSKMDY